LATLYSSFAAATVGMDWDTDSASANASLRSCIQIIGSVSGTQVQVSPDAEYMGQTSYLLQMFQRKGCRICSFNHGWSLQGEHRSTDSTL
jgi:hypothetical protein